MRYEGQLINADGCLFDNLFSRYNPCVMIICLFSNLIETFKIMDALNKRSGFQGITGVPDSRDVEKRFEEGDQKSKLAIDMFCYR